MMILLFYLALVVASVVVGEEVSDSRDHVDPLKYNPHEQIYKYDGNKREEEILKEINSPDYSQPTLVLDYRYMKTGGREYIQGPGGQYIILPYHVKSPQHTKFKNFDELLDYLQLKQLNKAHIRRENYDQRYNDRRNNVHRHDDRHHGDHHSDDRHHGDRHLDVRHYDEHRYDDHRYREHLGHRDNDY